MTLSISHEVSKLLIEGYIVKFNNIIYLFIYISNYLGNTIVKCSQIVKYIYNSYIYDIYDIYSSWLLHTNYMAIFDYTPAYNMG